MQNQKILLGGLAEADARIENNIFREMPNLAAQRFKADDPLRMHWMAAICLLSASDVTLRGNTFDGYAIALYLHNVRDVKIDSNHSVANASMIIEKTTTENVQIGKNQNIEPADAPEKVRPDIEYMNDFR